jgi:hypothetical protein
MKKFVFITTVVCLVILSCAYADFSHARDDSSENIDDIMQGFADEETPEDVPEDLLQGFEEDAGQNAEQGAEPDDFLDGFDQDAAEELGKSPDAEQKKSWSLEGEFAFTATYNFSADAEKPWRGFSMARPELELTLKKKFSDNWQGQIGARVFYDAVYSLRGRNDYTPQVLDEYEKEFELKDTFIQGSITDKLDTKIGRQIVVWGTLDNLRVTDVLNPLDLRVPGMTDIDDLRLPVTMVKFDYYFSNWGLSGMVIPEVRFSKTPAFGSDFYPYPIPRPPEVVPDDGFENAQFGAALIGVFSGWDIGLYGANIYADQAYGENISPGGTVQLVRKHARITMLGTAANLASGNWLLKGEGGWFDGLRYSNTPGIEYSRLDLGGGVEYSGFSEAIVSLEAVNRHIFDYNQQLRQFPDEIRANEFQWSLRFVKDFVNDTLTLTLLGSTFGVKADDGSFARLDAEYDITDGVSIRGGGVFYQSGDKGLFQDVAANDRLFVVCKYNF